MSFWIITTHQELYPILLKAYPRHNGETMEQWADSTLNKIAKSGNANPQHLAFIVLCDVLDGDSNLHAITIARSLDWAIYKKIEKTAQLHYAAKYSEKFAMLVRDNLHPLITASIMTEVRQLVEKHMVDLKLFLERPEPASETTEEGESSL